jgi:hypothetical protein
MSLRSWLHLVMLVALTAVAELTTLTAPCKTA